MDKTLPKDFCVMPFVGLHVATSGNIAPCCEFDGAWGNVANTSFADARQSDQAAIDRDTFANGLGRRIKPCWKCFDVEDRGGTSIRQKYNKELIDCLKLGDSTDDPYQRILLSDGAAYLDIRFSNLCNFKCRSCWHGSSSSWFKDAKTLGTAQGDKAEIRSIRSIDHLMAQIEPHLDDLKHVYFAGGEPLMIAENYQLLEILIARGRTDIALSYNTNGSRLKLGKTSMLDLWSAFKDLTIDLSVDATRQEAGSLIRSGFSMGTFVANTRAIREQCPHANITFGITVSALNVLELPQTLTDLRRQCGAMPDDFSIHALQQPDYMQPCVLPRTIAQRASVRLQDFIQNLDSQWGTPDQRDVLAKQLEGIRGALLKRKPPIGYIRLSQSQQRLDSIRSENSVETLSEVYPNQHYPMPNLAQKALMKAAKWRRAISRVVLSKNA